MPGDGNLVGSANVLEAAAGPGWDPSGCFCFSTSEVFGHTQVSRSVETDPTVTGQVGEARWTYAVSKLAEEHLALGLLPRAANCRSRWCSSLQRLRPRASRRRARCESSSSWRWRVSPILVHGDGTQIQRGATSTTWSTACCSASRIRTQWASRFNIGNSRAVTPTIYGLANSGPCGCSRVGLTEPPSSSRSSTPTWNSALPVGRPRPVTSSGSKLGSTSRRGSAGDRLEAMTAISA